jgi:hypothetical protein
MVAVLKMCLSGCVDMTEIFSEVPLAFQGTHFFLINCLKNFCEPYLVDAREASCSKGYIMCLYRSDEHII